MNTVEGAMVFTALAATVGLLLAGFSTVASRSAAESLARDVARVEALGGDGRAVAGQREPEAQVSIAPLTVAGQDAVSVEVRRPAALFDVTASATIIVEPDS